MKDVFGKALLDFQSGNYSEDITTYSSLDEKDTIPVPYLFRDYKNMPLLEQKALELCHGKVIDIGCGAGGHSLHLQEEGFDVTALDQSSGAIAVCRQRGLKKVFQADIMNYSDEKFDTLLMLMNGIGIVGNLEGLDAFLQHAEKLLKPNGCILLDSSDIVYMFETEEGNHCLPENKEYYGEVEFTMAYQGEKSIAFDWLYVDFDTLTFAAKKNGYVCEMLSEGEHYDYLAKLCIKM